MSCPLPLGSKPNRCSLLGFSIIIPGSHKSLIPHPALAVVTEMRDEAGALADFVECHMEAGDVLLCADPCMFGL